MERKLKLSEKEAWDRYQDVLDKYHEEFRVRNYDRVSVHEAFPEIKKAFDDCVELMKTIDLVETMKK